MPRTHHRRPASAVPFVFLIVMSLVTAMTGVAQAAPKKLHAVTALPSGASELRENPDGTRMTQAQRTAQLADDPTTPPTLGSSDYMGAPADKTFLESDKVFRETNTSGQAAGNVSTVASYGLKEDMSAIDGTTTEP